MDNLSLFFLSQRKLKNHNKNCVSVKKAHTLSRDVGLAVKRYYKYPYSRTQRFFRTRPYDYPLKAPAVADMVDRKRVQK